MQARFPFLIALLLVPVGFGQETSRVRELIERLNAERPEDRDQATRELKKLGKAALPELEKARSDPRPEVVERVKVLLDRIRLRDSLSPQLLAAFPEADERLSTVEDEPWLRLLLEAGAVKEGNPTHPGISGDDLAPIATRAFHGIAGNDDDRKALLDVLGRLRIIECAPLVARYLALDDETIQQDAMYCLGRMGARQFRSVVEGFLRSRREQVAGDAIWALSAMRSHESIPAIQALLDDPSVLLVSTAARALGQLDAQDAIPALERLLSRREPEICALAAGALGALGARSLIPKIALLAQEESLLIRMSATRALGALNPTDQEELLLRLLTDPAEQVRLAAMAALGRIRSRKAIPALEKTLGDAAWFSRQCVAAEALCELGSREPIPFILTKSRELLPLNALRNLAAWERLGRRTLMIEGEGTVRSLLQRLAKEGDFVLDLPPTPDPLLEGRLRQREQLWRTGRSTSILAALQRLTERWAVLVLDDGKVRVLSRADGLAFWKVWAKDSGPR